MYRLFIVSRDTPGIKHLENSVDWSRYGFVPIGVSYNGNDACQRIVEARPDILITDIQLPGMNGLELIQKVKGVYPDLVSVVISEYAEFVYAQKAIRCGVLGYCLKPFDDDEIANVLKLAKRALDKSRRLAENEILSLLFESAGKDKGEFASIFRMLGFRLDDGWSVVVLASAGPEPISFPVKDRSFSFKTGKRRYTYFINCDSERALTAFLKNYRADGTLGVGIGGRLHPCDSVREAADRAAMAAYQYFLTGEYGVYDSIADGTNRLGDCMKRLEAANEARNFVLIQNLFHEMEEKFKNRSFDVNSALTLYNLMTTFICEIDSAYHGVYVSGIEQLAERFGSVRDMLAHFGDVIKQIYSAGGADGKCTSKTFEAVLDYVNKHYCEDISLQTISSVFAINASYVCQLFKKELHVTFTEYLTKLRVSSAIGLIGTTDLTIGEISEKVGYANYFYFTKTFKKITGKTPTQYRSLQVCG